MVTGGCHAHCFCYVRTLMPRCVLCLCTALGAFQIRHSGSVVADCRTQSGSELYTTRLTLCHRCSALDPRRHCAAACGVPHAARWHGHVLTFTIRACFNTEKLPKTYKRNKLPIVHTFVAVNAVHRVARRHAALHAQRVCKVMY
jgi:hypothetical protein